MKFHEISWDFMWFHGSSWIFMDLHEILCDFMRCYADFVWNYLRLNYMCFFLWALQPNIFKNNSSELSSPVFSRHWAFQPSHNLKWISKTMGLPSPFFSNGLSPAQSKVEMNLKHLGAAQPGLKLKFSRDLVVLKLVDLLYLLNSLGCPAQWCLILISNLMGSPAQMNYGSYSPSTKGLYNPSLQHCFPHTLFCGAVQFVRI